MKLRTVSVLALAAAGVVACSAEASPSSGKVTIDFPSTQAAVATDYVELYVFDLASPGDGDAVCADKIEARKRKEDLAPSLEPKTWNICELLGGKLPVTIPHGDKAMLAVAERSDTKTAELRDLMIGCAVQRIGEGDAPVPIALTQIDESTPLPDTSCPTVADWCGSRCQ